MLAKFEIADLEKKLLLGQMSDFLKIDEVIGQELWSESNFLSDLPNKWNLSLIATSNKKLIGFLIASRKELSIHIHRLAIKQQFQSDGIGKTMVLRLIEKGESYKLPITLKVHQENIRALKFYKKLDFKSMRKSGTNIEMQFIKG